MKVAPPLMAINVHSSYSRLPTELPTRNYLLPLGALGDTSVVCWEVDGTAGSSAYRHPQTLHPDPRTGHACASTSGRLALMLVVIAFS